MRTSVLKLCVVVISSFYFIFVPSGSRAESLASALKLYQAGKIAEASREFENNLSQAEKTENPAAVWNALINFAWFKDEIGEHRSAIELSNRALQVASQSNDAFMIGRSLSWLGWAYSSLGLYELALDFYRNAVEVAAPNGKVQILNVWGLSTQEIGALQYKMGNLADGRRNLEKALAAARENKVGPGISEGAAHLAELGLTEGKFDEAETLAREAVSWGTKCDFGCTPYNTIHARLVLAKVLLEKARLDEQFKPEAEKNIRETLAAAKDAGLKRCIAEGKLLLAKALTSERFEERYKLITEAFETLADMESEMRGTAEAELGTLFLNNGDLKLADFYLKHGLKVNKELFRKVDNAFVKSDIANLSNLEGKTQRSLKQLEKALSTALQTNNLPLASETLTKLAKEYLNLGYATLAMQKSKQGLEITEKLLAQNENESIKNNFMARKLELSALFSEAMLRLPSAEAGSPPGA